VNYDNSLVVTITVTFYSWTPSSGDHLFTCGAIFWPSQLISVACLGHGRHGTCHGHHFDGSQKLLAK